MQEEEDMKTTGREQIKAARAAATLRARHGNPKFYSGGNMERRGRRPAGEWENTFLELGCGPNQSFHVAHAIDWVKARDHYFNPQDDYGTPEERLRDLKNNLRSKAANRGTVRGLFGYDPPAD
jgi:hypothetical protein